jgi:hypothetical protein
LAHRCFGKYVIDQVGGRLHHAACAATGAKASALATEGHQVLLMAAITLDSQKAVLQQSALEVILKLLADEFWQVAAGLFE